MVHPARLLLPCLLAVAALSGSALAVNTPPVLDTPTIEIVKSIPVGKTLIFPITATDADGDALTYTVKSSNARVLVRAKTGEPSLKLQVSYNGGTTGQMEFLLFREWAPTTVGFITGFAQSGFYDSVKFHRIFKDFILQTGDPLGNGLGGPGLVGTAPPYPAVGDQAAITAYGQYASTSFRFDNELQSGLIFTGKGQLAMANSGYRGDYSGSNGSQFFITVSQPRSLDFVHTIFGQLLRGWDTLNALNNVAVVSQGQNPFDPTAQIETSKPAQDVVITSATVSNDTQDAVLMLSSTGLAANVTITITVTDGKGGTDTKTMIVNAIADTTNDPPVVLPLPPQTTPQKTELDFNLTSFDLERDYTVLNHSLLSNSDIRLSTSGSAGGVIGNAGYTGQVRFGYDIAQFDVGSGNTETAVVKNYGLIGIGDRDVRVAPVTIVAQPATAFSGTVAQFQDADPAGSVADFTAQINWGDGTPVDAGTLARDSSVPGASVYKVTGSHTYARAGNYTAVVTLTGTKGAVAIARNPVDVTANTLVAVGEKLDVKGASVANRIVATFTDSTPLRAADYTATVDWGDGMTSAGVVGRGGSPSEFVVRGRHTYKDAEPFAIVVILHKKGALASADLTVMSSVSLTGFAPPVHLPPFSLVHLIGAWNSGPSKVVTNPLGSGNLDPTALKEVLYGTLTIINTGNRPSSQSVLRTFLSNNATLETGTDLKLSINELDKIDVVGFAAGAGGQGAFTVNLPKGTVATGKYLLTQLVYSDPIIDNSAAPKVIATGPLSGVIVYNVAGVLGQASSGQYLTIGGSLADIYHVTFKVVLDTPPTKNLTISVSCTTSANGEVEGSVDKSSLIFTPATWNVPQTVTVKGVADTTPGTQAYNVTLGTPLADGEITYDENNVPTVHDDKKDPVFSGTLPVVLPFANLDN